MDNNSNNQAPAKGKVAPKFIIGVIALVVLAFVGKKVWYAFTHDGIKYPGEPSGELCPTARGLTVSVETWSF